MPTQTDPPPDTRPRATLPLWLTGEVPGARGLDPVADVPALTPYWPEEGAGATGNFPAMVVCPGGGYGGLADHEGRDYALWLAARGVAAFVLKYRLGPAGYRHPAMLHDAQRAIRLVRCHAAAWRVDPVRVGVMGSSAGGHLAATALTHFDAGLPEHADPVERAGSRPDLGVLCYPVITMSERAHAGSRANLLGDQPDLMLADWLSNERHVTADTPPCFLWHTAEDASVNVQDPLDFAAALARCAVPWELHVYESGHHGLGLGVKGYDPAVHAGEQLLPWTRALHAWLERRGFVAAGSGL